MQSIRGWILDVYIEGSEAVLWLKSEDGRVIRLTDRYEPSFYVEPEEPSQIEELLSILSIHPNITFVEHERKYTSLSLEKTDVLHIYVDSVQNYKKVLFDLEKIRGIKSYYNLDLLHVQWYLFKRSLPPTSKVKVN